MNRRDFLRAAVLVPLTAAVLPTPMPAVDWGAAPAFVGGWTREPLGPPTLYGMPDVPWVNDGTYRPVYLGIPRG